jgi:cell division protein FtsW
MKKEVSFLSATLKKNTINKKIKAKLFYYDKWILVPVVLLSLFGLLMITSASLAVSLRDYGTPFHFFYHQFFYVTISAVIAYFSSKISLKKWEAIAPYLLILCMLGLILVIMPGVGKSINGAKRWLSLGFFHVQVSEIVKLAVIIYFARYLKHKSIDVKKTNWGFIRPLIVLAILSLLLLCEPDFGATTVISVIAFGMMFLGGLPIRKFILLLIIGLAILAALIIFAPYRLERMLNFLNPWENPLNGGYQLTQALMSFGRGGIWGVGLGNSIQKLFYLPEAHTDFLFAVIGEELGLVGCLLLLSGYVVLVARVLMIARIAAINSNYFDSYISYGIAFWLSFQSFINVGVNIGILPTKGLTLPFISYGGSSLLVSAIIFGILLRIYHENSNSLQSTKY